MKLARCVDRARSGQSWTKRGIPVATFRWWRWRLRRDEAEKPALLLVRVVGSAAPRAREHGDEAVEVEALLPDGTRLRFGPGATAELLAKVLSRLRRC